MYIIGEKKGIGGIMIRHEEKGYFFEFCIFNVIQLVIVHLFSLISSTSVNYIMIVLASSITTAIINFNLPLLNP